MLKSIDVFGCEFRMMHDRNYTFKTGLGGLMTIFMGMTLLVLMWYFGQDIYEKQNPFFLKKSNQSMEYPFHSIGNDNMFFALKIIDTYSNTIDDPRYFEVLARSQLLKTNISTGVNEVINEYIMDGEKCNDHHLDIKANPSLSSYYCANFSNISIGGEYEGSADMGIFSFFIRVCNADTEWYYNITCATFDEMQSKYKGNLYVSYYTLQHSIDPKNIEEPVKGNYVYDYDDLSLLGQTHKRIFYTISEFSTDNGIIFEENTNFEFLEFEHIVTGYNNNIPQDNVIFDPTFQISRRKNYYTRKYIKIQEIAAIVGGFVSIFLTGIKFVFSFYLDNAYSLFLYEKLLNLEVDEEAFNSYANNNFGNNNKNNNDNKNNYNNYNNNNHINVNQNVDISHNLNNQIELSNIGLSNNNYNNSSRDLGLNNHQNLSNLNNPNNPLNGPKIINKAKPLKEVKDIHLNELIKYNNKKRVKITPTFCGQCKYNYMSCKQTDRSKTSKTDLYCEADYEIVKKLDLIHMFKKHDQWNLLSQIVLNKEQYFMLKNRDLKTLVKEPNEIAFSEKMIHEINREKNIRELKTYVNFKSETKNLNSTDRVLLSFMQDDLKKEIKVNELEDQEKMNKTDLTAPPIVNLDLSPTHSPIVLHPNHPKHKSMVELEIKSSINKSQNISPPKSPDESTKIRVYNDEIKDINIKDNDNHNDNNHNYHNDEIKNDNKTNNKTDEIIKEKDNTTKTNTNKSIIKKGSTYDISLTSKKI